MIWRLARAQLIPAPTRPPKRYPLPVRLPAPHRQNSPGRNNAPAPLAIFQRKRHPGIHAICLDFAVPDAGLHIVNVDGAHVAYGLGNLADSLLRCILPTLGNLEKQSS